MNKQIFSVALLTVIAKATDYTYGGDCGELYAQDCAKSPTCTSCKWSWPSDDPAQWGSQEALCRCESCGGSPCPEPTASDFAFGSACGSLTDGECASDPGCTSCNWSWPALDPAQWSSTQAACRCKIGGDGSPTPPNPNPDTDTRDNYEYGNDCDTLENDYCDDVWDCNKCAWAWPKDDPAEWNSSAAACRCQSSDSNPYPIPDPANYEFGDDCLTLQDQDCNLVDCVKCAWSWPKDDPMSWSSDDARCRCEYKQGDELPDERDPPLKVQIDGVETTLYVAYPKWWSEAATDGEKELTFDYNNRMYLATSREEDPEAVDPTKYFKPNMLGGSFEYDVDLSQVGCGCVTALYTILMPSVDDNDDPWKYCDAAAVGGYLCPEFDIMEANKYAFYTTAHKCNAPDADGNYDWCDRSGQCTSNLLDSVSGNSPHPDFMPGSTTGINTEQEFHVKIDFHDTNGQFSGYTLKMTQGDKEVVYNKSDCSYLNGMTSDVQQMVFAISNWSGDISWLQHNACQGQCSQTATFSSFKNLSFSTAGHVPPPPPPPVDDTVYMYGDKCTADHDISLCGEDCYNCHLSIPFGDQWGWNSPAKACRCLPDQRAPQGYTYSETQHTSNEDGLCNGCDDCRLSWPADASEEANSPEAMYRCKPDEAAAPELSYGPGCANHYDMLCGADCHDCRESWPTDDPRKWYSENAFCRCKAEEIREVIFGESCSALDEGKCGTHCRECNMSWEATDAAGDQGATAECRCKRSW